MKLTFLKDYLHKQPDELANSSEKYSRSKVCDDQLAGDALRNNEYALASKPCLLTIGNFDGVHLGHQAMLNLALTLAKQKQLALAVMVFEPMPKEFFSAKDAPARLMNIEESQYIFSTYQHDNKHIDELIVVNFDDEFRSQSADEFIKLLKTQLNVTTMVIGDDFRFGSDRTGDHKSLSNAGLAVTTLNTIKDNHTAETMRISSTRIRELLAQGWLDKANSLLGRDYFMIGEVQHGDKIGRTLDFPTANVALSRIKPPLHGVYAVDVQVLDKEGKIIKDAWQDIAEEDARGFRGLEAHSLFGTANVGTRPAVNGKEWRLEVHFPEFKGNLYGKKLKVRFLHFLHGERSYNGLDELKAGIKQDVVDLLAWRARQLVG